MKRKKKYKNKKIKLFKNSIPISTKNRTQIYSNLLFNEIKEKDNIKKDENNKTNFNKTSSLFHSRIPNGIDFKKNSIYYIPYNNNVIHNYLKGGIKKEKETSVDIIPSIRENCQNCEKEKKIIFLNDIPSNNEVIKNNINNSNSIYNINSIEYFQKENNSIKLSEKKEHLFSFGSDLFYIDNNNNNKNHINILINKTMRNKMYGKNNFPIKNERRKNLLNKLFKRNSIGIKVSKANSNTFKSKNISTNYSGSNSLFNINSYINGTINKNNSKNGIDKNNTSQIELHSANKNNILNDKNEFINIQTTLQTLSDCKIFELANNYITEDNSLESYRKKSVVYNKKHFGDNFG